jgi:hypothetical protein
LRDVFLACAHYVAHYVERHLCCCIVDTEVLAELLRVLRLHGGLGGVCLTLGIVWVILLDWRGRSDWGDWMDGDFC